MIFRALLRFVFVLLLGTVAACSGNGGSVEPPVNRPPTIALVFSKIGIVRNSTAQISVNISDLDGDPMTVSWSATRGTITSLNSANTLVEWTTPGTVGVDSITAEVSDGTSSRSATIEIKVGFAFSGANAPSVFMKSRSPYILTVPGIPPVLTVTGTPTTIEPGTELLLETAGAVIDVSDSLIAVGSASEPIVIRPNLRNLTCGDDRGWWQGVKVANDIAVPGHLELNHVQLSYGQWAVRLLERATATIRNSDLRCSGTSGVLHEGSGVLILEDTRIRDGRLDGVAVDALTFLPDSIRIDGCEIAFNGRTGIALKLEDQQAQSPIVVEYSNIEYNGEHGITLDRAVFPRIHYNRFFGNGVGSQSGLNHIWLFSGYPAGALVTTLDATCNFWGAPVTNVSTIEATIRDMGDTGTVGTDVNPSPWSNENPLVTTSTCVVP